MFTNISSTAMSTWAIIRAGQPARCICSSTKAMTASRFSAAAAIFSSAIFVPPGRLVYVQQQHGDVVRLLRAGGEGGDVGEQQPELLGQRLFGEAALVEEGQQPRLGIELVFAV